MRSKNETKEQGNSAPSYGNKTTIEKQQAKILLAAIDNYLSWRDNKKIDDNRGYRVTIFTWLRHYTAFGKKRANELKQALSSNNLHNILSLLKRHFTNHSRLKHHSLDTYLLEAILDNKKLFLIHQPFSKLNTHSDRQTLRQFILEQNLIDDKESAFRIAKLYEDEEHINDNIKQLMA